MTLRKTQSPTWANVSENSNRVFGALGGAPERPCCGCVVWSNEAAAVHGAPVTSGRDLFYRQRDRHLLSMLRSG